jgi:hypothetical protein
VPSSDEAVITSPEVEKILTVPALSVVLSGPTRVRLFRPAVPAPPT